MGLVKDQTISLRAAKVVFGEIFLTGKSAKSIVDEKGLVQISDTSALEKIVDDVIKKNPKSVADFKGGQTKAISFLMGQAMKMSQGKANPKLVNEMIKNKLS